MCGITGFLDFAGGMDEGLLRRMVTTLRHRGPDDKGVFVHRGEEGAVGLEL